ncbi:MAG: hypothetical protein AB7T06_26415 [Kofleriaceae bacterium]
MLDAITLALVPGVVLTRLLPHLIEDGAAGPVAGLVGGYVGFQLLEARAHRNASRVGVAMVLPALAIHAVFDGATLGLALGGDATHVECAALIGAVLLHRIPEGLFVGSIMANARRAVVWSAVVLLASLTVLGALVGGEVLSSLPHDVSHVGIAVGLGIMVRMVVDRHGGEALTDDRTRLFCGVSFVACLILLVVVPNAHDVLGSAAPHELTIRQALVPLFLETAPSLFVLLALSTLAAAWLGADSRARDRDTWASSSLLSIVLLGPWIGLIRAATSPVARALLGRIRDRWWWLPRARDVLPTYAVAVLVASVVEAAMPAHLMLGVPDAALVVAVAMFAIVVPSGAGAPVLAAVLAHKGGSSSAVLALVVATSLHPFVSTISTRLIAAAIAALGALALSRVVAIGPLPELHHLGAHHHAVYEWCLGIGLACWITIGLARAGPRAWLQ